MNGRTPIINATGDYEENLERLAKALKKASIRREILSVVYGRGSKPKSKKQIAEILGLNPTFQGLQNALEYMANHHLILRIPNDGTVKDGSRHLYGKDEFVRVNRDKIVSLADNPSRIEKLQTKRKNKMHVSMALPKGSARELKKRKLLKILYLYSNPDPDPNPDKYIRPDAEARIVQESIRGSRFRDNVTIAIRPAAGLKTIQDGLNDLTPQVVHFSGHSDLAGILADNGSVNSSSSEYLTFDLLSAAFAAMDTPPTVVVLNSCYSAAARKKILESVSFMIGMTDSISDIAASAFAQRFYAALASGASVRSAFDQGVVALSAASLDERHTAKLFESGGCDSRKVTLT